MATAIYTATLPEANTDTEETIIEEIIETLTPDVAEVTDIEMGMYSSTDEKYLQIPDDHDFFKEASKFHCRWYKNFLYIAVQNETDDVVVGKTDDASVQTEPVDVALPAEVNDVAVETDAVNTSDAALQTDATELVDVSIITDLIYLQIH